MENETNNITYDNDFLKKLLKISKENIIARENTRTFWTNKKKDNPQAEATLLNTKYELYEILSGMSAEDRQTAFKSLDSYFEHMAYICQMHKLKGNSIVEMEPILGMRMAACRNVERVYFEALAEHFVSLSSKALWASAEIDYQNEVAKIREELSNIIPEEMEKLKSSLFAKNRDLQEKVDKTLSVDEYALAEQESRACKLLTYLSAELTEDNEQVDIPCK